MSAKAHTAKPRKRVDAVPPSGLKRGSNGSAFIKCDSCNKDIPAALSDMHDCALEAKTKAVVAKIEQPVQTLPPAKENTETPSKASEKQKITSQKPAKGKKKHGREKDPDEPKRPPTAFFLFMEEFRKTYKDCNPDKKSGPAQVAKDGGDKWRSMSDEEKDVFMKRASQLKEEYKAAHIVYMRNKRLRESGDVQEGSDESQGPVTKDDATVDEDGKEMEE